MSRCHRPNLPGVPFHVTARIQNREPFFRGLERQIVHLIRECAPAGDVRLVAHAVMPNHLHLVVFQGGHPLGWYMQRLLRRIALMVIRSRNRQGHVFERRYYSAPCLDATYFRNAIAYVHLNPVRAGLCGSADGYEWTSHGSYARSAPAHHPTASDLEIVGALRAFASSPTRMLGGCRADYRAFLGWRHVMDRFIAAGGDPFSPLAPRAPVLDGGDAHWAAHFAASAALAAPAHAPPPAMPAHRPDLHRIAQLTLAEEAPDLGVEWLRLGCRSRQLVRLRQLVIARALAAGHSCAQICRFLNVSTSSVSRVSVLLRRSRFP
jgi:REP element-mobilizing transposase RayT